MATKTQICNLALLRVGVSQTLTDVDVDTSKEALTCNLFWDDERKFVLRDFAWPWARKYLSLTLVEGSTGTPTNPDWIYAYQYPSDCVLVRRLVTCAGRQETSPPPFVIGRLTNATHVVYTNLGAAMAEYTVNVTDAAEFDSNFVSMLAWRLAAQLAASLARSAELQKSALEMYAAERTAAITRALEEGEYAIPSGDPDPRVRDIFNLAITRLGISRNLVATDPELTFAALWPRVSFAEERDYVLRDFPWPWATAYADLARIAGTNTEPVNFDWFFTYEYPGDAVFVRRVVTPLGRLETNAPAFSVGSGITNPEADPEDQVRGRLIYASYANDDDTLTVEYTQQITDPTEFDPHFVSLLAWRLAALLAPSIAKTKNDVRIVDRCHQQYEIEKSRAHRAALLEGKHEKPFEAEWIRER